MRERRYIRVSLLLASMLLLYFSFRIFEPFFVPLCLALILSTLTYPAYDWTRRHLWGRRNLAALLTCLWVTVLIILPVTVLLILLAGEVSIVYQSLQSRLESGQLDALTHFGDGSLFKPVQDWLSNYVDLEDVNLLEKAASALQQVSLFFLRHSTSILTGLFSTITSFFIMMASMFFLFRDGEALMEEIKTLLPLSESYQQTIIRKFTEVASATVLGSLLTAICQGVAGGLVFWMLGISNVVFWGFLTALFSLVPIVGTGIVWVPWVLYLLAIHSPGRALVLALLELGLVGLIDNFLRPLFILGKTKMHTMVVFFSIMGGIGYFGILGMIFGPIIVALGLTSLELYKIEFRQELDRAANPGRVGGPPES